MENPFENPLSLVARAGVITITGAAGVAFLWESLVAFNLEKAALGAILLVVAALIEFFTWSRQLTFAIEKLRSVNGVEPPLPPGPKKVGN